MPIVIKKKVAGAVTKPVSSPPTASLEDEPTRPLETKKGSLGQAPRPSKEDSKPVTDAEREKIRKMLGAKESPAQRGGADLELFLRVVAQTEPRPCKLCGHAYTLPCDGEDKTCTNKIWREQRLAAEKAKEKA